MPNRPSQLPEFELTAKQQEFEVIAYCVMPDHFDGLVQGSRARADLRELVRKWKQLTGYRWKRSGHGTALWQEGYFDRVLRERDRTEAVVHYIVANPLRAGLIKDLHEYP